MIRARLRLPLVLALGAALALPGFAQAFTTGATMFRNMQAEASAFAVSVKQSAIGANQVALSSNTSSKQLANAQGAIGMSKAARENAVNFSGRFGLSPTLKCEGQSERTVALEAQHQRQRDGTRLMANYSGERMASQAQADADALKIHLKTYCTVAAAKQGLCTLQPNGMQGWDVNYSGAFSERTLSPEGEAAAYAYVALVTDARSSAEGDCSGRACEAAQGSAMAVSAFASMAAASFVDQATDRRVPILTGN